MQCQIDIVNIYLRKDYKLIWILRWDLWGKDLLFQEHTGVNMSMSMSKINYKQRDSRKEKFCKLN